MGTGMLWREFVPLVYVSVSVGDKSCVTSPLRWVTVMNHTFTVGSKCWLLQSSYERMHSHDEVIVKHEGLKRWIPLQSCVIYIWMHFASTETFILTHKNKHTNTLSLPSSSFDSALGTNFSHIIYLGSFFPETSHMRRQAHSSSH